MNNIESELPFISVIIPTYYDWERLQLCVNALNKQTYSVKNFEIIVVNNAPDDKAPDSLVLPENCFLLDERKPGSYAARNKALSIAKGDVYAFTDSDCQPKEDWLEVAIDYLKKNPQIDRIGGEISLFSENEKMNWFEIYEVFFAFPQEEFVQSGMAATGNMISRKSVFDELGVFNENLMSGGDGEWGRRVFKQGSQITYLRNCVVFHPTRSEFKDIHTKNKRLAGGHLSVARSAGKKSVAILLLKKILPPFTGIKRAFANPNQPTKKKLIAILVCYYLKLKALSEMLSLLLGSGTEERV